MNSGIPDFDEFGDLPPGTYRVTEAQIEARYAGQNLVQRDAITASLLGFLNFLRDFAILVYIDGSYVTENLRPGDAEVLVLLPEGFDFDSHRGQMLLNYISEKTTNYLDIHPCILGRNVEDLAEHIKGWTVSKDVAHRQKGILLMEFNQ